jgi:hypothetical protein
MTEEQECGIRNAECGIKEHRTEEQECGIRNAECGIEEHRTEEQECGRWMAEGSECGLKRVRG